MTSSNSDDDVEYGKCFDIDIVVAHRFIIEPKDLGPLIDCFFFFILVDRLLKSTGRTFIFQRKADDGKLSTKNKNKYQESLLITYQQKH